MTSYWRWIGNGLVLDWPRIHTQLDGLTSDWPLIGRGSISDWHWIGTGLVWIDSVLPFYWHLSDGRWVGWTELAVSDSSSVETLR